MSSNVLSDDLPGIGHNRPDDLIDELRLETEAHQMYVEKLQAAARSATCENSLDAERCVILAAKIGQELDELDDERKRRVRPFIDSQRAINAHYAELTAPLGLAKERLLGKIDGYRKQVEQTNEAPVVINTGVAKTSTRKTTDVEVTDWQMAVLHCLAVDPAPIREAVQKAYKKLCRGGATSLPGATIHTDSKTIVL